MHKDFVANDRVKCNCHTCARVSYHGFLDAGKCSKHKKYLGELGMDGYSKFNCEHWNPIK